MFYGVHSAFIYHLLQLSQEHHLNVLCLAGQGVPSAQQNRNYTMGAMSNEIHEIIRVLQLTTYDEEEWDADDITVMKKALVCTIWLLWQPTWMLSF